MTGETTTFPDGGDAAPEERAPPRPQLYLVLECDRLSAGGARYALADVDEIVVGRGDARRVTRESEGGVRRLNLKLPGRFLSSLHARIVRQSSDWILEDAHSTNGSFVNGERVTRRTLRSSDVVELGHKVFVISSAEPTPIGTFSDTNGDIVTNQRGMTTLIPSLSEQFAALRRIAPTALSVLILGETGTGKELIAQAIHELSKRSGPLVAVNCGALTSTLAESQLFGHSKGAFSGAVRDELGFVRSAQRGSLLLDEVGDLPEAAQPILLRVLQDRRVVAVGNAHPHEVDVRFIAATHRDISELVASSKFRRDLLARLNGFIVRLPPLRERLCDLGLLIRDLVVAHFSDREIRLAPDAATALLAYDWPANIRELEQCLLRAAALSSDHVIRKTDLPPEFFARVSVGQISVPSEQSENDGALRKLLVERLEQHQGNISEVARSFGKARIQIQRWMKKFNVRAEQFRK